MPQVKLSLPVADELFMKWLDDLSAEKLLPNLAEVKKRIDLASGLLPVDVQMEIEDLVAMKPASMTIARTLASRNRISLRAFSMEFCDGRCDECVLEQICQRRIGEVNDGYLNITPALTSPVVRKILKLEV